MAKLRRLVPLVLFILLVKSAVLAQSDDATAGKSRSVAPVNVGVILALSGELQRLGEGCRNAMELALEGLPESKRAALRLQYEDDRFKPAETVSAFTKLLAQPEPNRAKVIVTFGSGTSKAVANRSDEAQVPQIAIATDSRLSQGRTHVVNFWPNSEELVRVLVEEMMRRGYKRIGRVGTLHDFSENLNQEFDKAAQGKIEVAIDETFPIDVKDFRSFIVKARAVGRLDGILITLLPSQVGLFAKQTRQLGLTLPLAGIEVFEDAEEVKISEGTLIGQWYVNIDDPTDEFTKLYQAKYPRASVYATGLCFDIVNVIAEAVAQHPDGSEINSYLHSLKDFRGAMGVYSAKPGNTYTFRGAVKEVTAAGFKRIGPAV